MPKGKYIRTESYRKKQSESHKGKRVPPFSEEHKLKISNALKGKPLAEETKRKMSVSAKLKVFSEEHRKNMSRSHKGVSHSEEWNKNVSISLKGKPKSEESKRKNRESHLGRKQSESAIQKFRISIKKRFEDPIKGEETRKKMRVARTGKPSGMKGKHVSDEGKIKRSVKQKGKPHSEGHRLKLTEANVGGFWYGNPTLHPENRRKSYCEKWCRDLWVRIDAAWEYRSAISRKTRFENHGQAHLDRHHVYWQEKACCEWDEDTQGYYAMINIGTKAKPVWHKHYIKGDPNKFVLLTRDEHGMVKGSKMTGKDKLWWIKFFEDLIEKREAEGKSCYLSKEEYEIYKTEHAETIAQYNPPRAKKTVQINYAYTEPEMITDGQPM